MWRRHRILPERSIIVKVDADGIPGFWRIVHPIHHLLFLLGVRTKKPVPDDEKFSKILIQVTEVDTMVHPVVRRSRENEFNPAPKFWDKFCVMEECYEEMKSSHGINRCVTNASERHA